MDKLQIGEIIFKLRKEKGITQDQLGGFIGVSTAAVSKWESGNSYPDITLLPVLASYFNVSIDKLLNYKIELSEKEVMEIFKKCEVLFSSDKVDEGIDKSMEYISKYKSSYYLKYMIGCLFNMYSWKKGEEKIENIMLKNSVELLENVVENCNDTKLVEQALFQLGGIYSSIGENDKGIEALNKIHKNQFNVDFMLANIYLSKNEMKEARKILQSQLWKNIFGISFTCLALAKSYIKDKNSDVIDKYCNLAVSVKKLFSPECDKVIGMHVEYMNFAQIYLRLDENKKAIEMLYKWIQCIKNNDINAPKDFSSTWCFNELSEGERAFTLDLYENMMKVLEDPVFDPIRKSNDFKAILKDLKEIRKLR
ncbi:XRE family transcriptional regulator [Clostridium autoethanogenum]|uniref:XRE family transcriptional regulator n=1 Tax=Clostridium autoethanogenum TaxID=84023 RepID=A0A3M0T1C4_9CLOT|nr:helix-turn-helix transcriptional regulator [Clostridium autoethanogenum]RMD04035.1 XRE family transcriptional regulator [Clostridium autoethanogenum]